MNEKLVDEGTVDDLLEGEDYVMPEPNAFDMLVADVLDSLPEEWNPLLDRITIVIEDEPTAADLHEEAPGAPLPLGRARGDLIPMQLLGGGLTGPAVAAPPEIVLFQGPLERASQSEEDLLAMIRTTLIREIGHALGLVRNDESYETTVGDPAAVPGEA